MPDDKKLRGKPDRDRINVNEPYEVGQWCEHFGCTPEQLKAAVRAVGPNGQRCGSPSKEAEDIAQFASGHFDL